MGKNTQSFIVLGMSIALTGAFGCASPGKKTAIGAGAGAAAGAGVGAIVGGGKGALIGAGVGATVGGVIGNRLDKQAAELKEVAETKRTADGIMVNLKNDLLFETGSAKLTPQAKNQLNELGDVLVKYPTNKITVLGHTDNVGSMTLNEMLSEKRANAVRDVLAEKGVPENQLRSEGYGETQPIAPNTKKSERAKNRRVELKIVDVEAQSGAG